MFFYYEVEEHVKKRFLYLFIMVGCIFLISVHHEEAQKDFNDYFNQLNEEYSGNTDEILAHIDEKLQSSQLNSLDRGINLLAREHYLYLKGSPELLDYIEETESYLTQHNQDKELMHFYSLLSSRYSGLEQYDNAYIYIYRGEQVAKKNYDIEKNQETLSTLIAIKYLKSVIALDIGMIEEADNAFLEAEELRNELINHEHVDIYNNILLYHQSKNNYELVEEYAKKMLQIIEEQDPELYYYKTFWIGGHLTLAKNYLYQEDIASCLETIEDIVGEEALFDSSKSRSKLYSLYGEILLYHNEPQEALNYFVMAYEEIKESSLVLKKVKLVYSIINTLKQLNAEKQLIDWYEIERQLMRELFDIKESQYLLNQIIDTDLQNAKYNIEVLKLQRKNLIYFSILLGGFLGLSLFIVITEQRRKKLLQMNMTVLEHNLQIKHQYYEDIKLHQDNLQRVKHDLKNHMSIIHQLMKDKDYEDAQLYIQSIEEKIEFPLTDVITQNKIIDAILINKLRICREKGIKVQYDIQIPRQLVIEDFDLCVLYGNLLDNAIEACEQMSETDIKYIHLKSFLKNDYLYLNIKNSFSSKLKIKGNRLLTLKTDKLNHGFGIRNVQQCVKKYQGHLKITHENQEFNVSLLLNTRNN